MAHQLLTIDEIVLAEDFAKRIGSSRSGIGLIQGRLVVVPVTRGVSTGHRRDGEISIITTEIVVLHASRSMVLVLPLAVALHLQVLLLAHERHRCAHLRFSLLRDGNVDRV